MAATFHPQVMRGGASMAGAGHPPSTSTIAAGISTAAAAPSRLPASSSSPTSNTAPIHGLKLDATSFPLHPYFASSSTPTSTCGTVRLITAHQYAQLVKQHSSLKIQDENVLFPWLHGADIPYSAQAENFGFRNGDFKEVPRCVTLSIDLVHSVREGGTRTY